MPADRPDPAAAHAEAIDAVLRAMREQLRPPLELEAGPWPLTADTAGIGDDVHRALLADDWAESGMRAKQLQRLIDAQLVARNRQLSADHPGGRDLGLSRAGERVGRILLDLDDDLAGASTAAVTIVDIAIHPQHQHTGIGREALRALLAAAADTNRDVRVTAVFGTPALAWFLAAGFVESGGDVLYRQLRWSA
ncbi:GNAT family N-acetyltransferase [Nakamurella sp. GG22]